MTRGRIHTASLVVALVAVGLASASAGQNPPSRSAQGPPGGSPPGLDKAIEAKEKHADQLLDKPGVVGVGVALNPAGKAIIKVYKDKPDVADVPDSLDGVEVESVVTGVIEARAPTDRFPRPVPIGVSSGLADVATGTIGARVTDGTRVFALSNNHVFAGINTANIGDPIVQPGVTDGGSDPADRIATLYDYQAINFNAGSTNTMDAAIALSSTANLDTATPSDGYGNPSNLTTQATLGMPVQKYGRTTGFQLGTVAATDVSVDVCYLLLLNICFQEARFVGQISVSPGTFSGPGDSGSLIVTQGGNQPVALLFAGGDGLTIGTPIDVVLQRFGVTIDGQPPGNGPPSAPTALSALAGDGSVSLSWNAPTFDGGSAITGYRVYRGTSAGGESLLQSVGTGTTFADTSVSNGTNYYYKVSAVNALGEGALSNEASATPGAFSLPAEPLPVLDGFDRADENPLSDAGRWSNGILNSGESGLVVSGNALACTRTTTCSAWRSNAQYGPDVEAWATFATMPGNGNALRLYARLQQPGSAAVDGYVLRAVQQSGTDQVLLDRLDNGALVNLRTVSQELAQGDTILLRASGSTLEAWRHDGSAWSRLATVADATTSAAGYVGVSLRGTTGRLDDFGGRTMGDVPPPPEAPGTPLALTAQSGNGVVELDWQPPGSDGGSQLTGYRVYRGPSPGGETLLQSTGTGTSFSDTSVANGTTYYYKVSAVNAVGEGPRSNEASATPTDVFPPAEPLSILDDFNRPNESPLADAGRWAIGIAGSGESGLNVNANTLACTRSTICSGWRRNALYGPDAEVSAKIATLPGDGNGLRLYVRLQQPGSSSTVDGYVLRWTQQAGADQLLLDRLTNGAFANLLTLAPEIALGDTLLVRVQGSRLEVWRRSGGDWTRLGFVADTTYPGAGYVGVGIRGTTGRLDDFGARVASPTPPGAPTSLSATAGNASVSLSWTAPVFDGGVSLTYRVYRGTSPGGESLLQSAGAGTGFTDTTVTNGTTYYYKVSAENASGEGPLSNEVSATPSGVFPPDEPLPVLDSFDRPNESPLSGGGSWGNGIVGSGESGLKVTSNALACSRSTICSGWHKTNQYGPDAEAWAKITTLPGNGNGLRLYVRLQSPGSSGADGYVLRWTQQSGADQLLVDRMTNGSFSNRLTLAPEIAAGHTLLLRATGSTLEVWQQDGSSWSRLGVVVDSTYAAAGYVGVALRGTAGRLDDFGARTLP